MSDYVNPGDPQAPPHKLVALLACDKDPATVSLIARNPNTPLATLAVLAPLHAEDVAANPALALFGLERPDESSPYWECLYYIERHRAASLLCKLASQGKPHRQRILCDLAGRPAASFGEIDCLKRLLRKRYYATPDAYGYVYLRCLLQATCRDRYLRGYQAVQVLLEQLRTIERREQISLEVAR